MPTINYLTRIESLISAIAGLGAEIEHLGLKRPLLSLTKVSSKQESCSVC